MICATCKDYNHEPCKGLSWCDCQHRLDAEFSVEVAKRDVSTTPAKKKKSKKS